MKTGEIIIYQTAEGQTALEVHLENDTVWLTQEQMAELFGKNRRTITEHIGNIFKERELEDISVCRKFRHTATDGKKYETQYYNLDVIISVGYRVKSSRGTQFRIWANKVLKEYLIQGYAVRQQLQSEQLQNLIQTVKLLAHVTEHQQLTAGEASGLLKVITDYAYGLEVLDKYDYQQLSIEQTTATEKYRISYTEAIETICKLKQKFGGSDLFGHEKDQSFQSSINTIYQTFGGKELYPSVEEKAANLLYFVVKNHSFSDGNKRIAAFLFLWFLERNKILYNDDGSKRIADNALVALTLMIAESKTEEKDTMIKVVVNLINQKNR
jgi:prophage maintenance system killer protein